MKLDEQKIAQTHVPESIKTAHQNFRMHEVVKLATGLDDLTFEKLAFYFGGRLAARNAKWRPVADGLMALKALQG